MIEGRRVPRKNEPAGREEKRQIWLGLAASLNDQFTGSLPDDFELIGLYTLRKDDWDPRWEKVWGELEIEERTFIQEVIGAGLRAEYKKVGDFRGPQTEVPDTKKPLAPFYEEMLTRLFEPPTLQQ